MDTAPTFRCTECDAFISEKNYANHMRMVHGKIPKDDINEVLKERGKNYGEFDDFARISQQLKKSVFHNNTAKFTSMHIEALEMICHKIARIANGDPDHVDSWRDITGYAQLVVNLLEGKKSDGSDKR